MFLLCGCDTSTTLYVAAVVLEIQVYYLATSVAGDGKVYTYNLVGKIM